MADDAMAALQEKNQELRRRLRERQTRIDELERERRRDEHGGDEVFRRRAEELGVELARTRDELRAESEARAAVETSAAELAARLEESERARRELEDVCRAHEERGAWFEARVQELETLLELREKSHAKEGRLREERHKEEVAALKAAYDELALRHGEPGHVNAYVEERRKLLERLAEMQRRLDG